MPFKDFLLILITVMLGGATPQPRLPQQQSVPKRIEFQEFSFQLPGSGWNRTEGARQVTFARSEKPAHSQTLGVWAVDFGPAISGWSKQQHISAYFDMERHQERPANVHWEKFVESARTIEGNQYPTLSFHTTATGYTIAVGSDGLFLLYFPVDFQQRRAFYCLMWEEMSPIDEPKPPLDLQILDSVLSSFRVQPLASPAEEIRQPTSNQEAKLGGGDNQIASLLENAQSGDVRAQEALGLAYLQGKGVSQSNSEAFRWTLKAAEAGAPVAQANLGSMYANGWGVPRDYAKALEWYGKSAQQGSFSGQYGLGRLYADGSGVPRDDKKAVELFRKAAEQGFSLAQQELAEMYGQGRGVQQDYAEAARWSRKAAEQGFAPAQFSLGALYRDGQGVNRDYAQALSWLRKAADQGHMDAQLNLATMYLGGRGVSKNSAEAAKWFQAAAEQGHPLASYNMGVFYEKGDGVPKNLSTSYFWMRIARAAGFGEGPYYDLFVQLREEERSKADKLVAEWLKAHGSNANFQAELAYMCWLGEGVPKDAAEAVKWARPAAEAGNPRAQSFMGGFYAEGAGVPKDNVEAAKWFRQAAEQGFAPAQFSLGTLYRDGHGVNRDYVQALSWLRKAADQGHMDAQTELGNMYYSGLGGPKNSAEAAKWFQAAAEQGDPAASFGMGFLYANGDGVPKDLSTSYFWMRIAHAAGFGDALDDRLARTAGFGDSLYYLLSAELSEEQRNKADKLVAEWLKAHGSNANFQAELAYMCWLGEGVPKDAAEAVKWARPAAEAGNARAQDLMGDFYADGAGLPKDYVEAAKWFRMAAAQGNLDAEESLGELYNDGGQGVEKNEAEAIQWYRKAIEHKSASSSVFNALAWIFATSENPNHRDPVKALEYAKKAVELSEAKEAAILDTLAEAFFVNGQYDQAIEAEKKAIAVAREKDRASLKKTLEKYKEAKKKKS
jgi:TPR repeat protein